MATHLDVARQVATGPVVDVRQAETTPPWRRILEIAGGLLIVGVVVQTPLTSWSWVVAVAAIAAVRSVVPTRAAIARTADLILLIRLDTLLRPGIAPALVATTTADRLTRVRPGLVTDRWQVDQASVSVPRWERNRLDRWRTAQPISAS